MAKQTINVGTAPNTRSGDTLRAAFVKANENFTELYNLANADVQIPSQTGKAGKVLKTTGAALLFENVSYNELTDRPTLFSGSYNDLSNKPLIFSGNYSDLAGRPTLFSGSYNDLSNKPTLATVATTGSYNDLINKPTISGTGNFAFSGNNITTTVLNDVVIRITGQDQNVPPNTYDHSWTFDIMGTLSLPGNLILAGSYFTLEYDENDSSANQAQIFHGFTDKHVYIGTNSYSPNQFHRWKFATNGDLTLPANGDILDSNGNSKLVDRTEGTRTLQTGSNTITLTLPENGTFNMWLKATVNNGVIAYNSTVTITNANLPVLGQQFAYAYSGAGTLLDFTSLPSQIVGTAGSVTRSATLLGTPANNFEFVIDNTSGTTVTLHYGWSRV
jgi:hypothetical protein